MALDFVELMKDATTRGTELLNRAPTTAEEAIGQLLILNMKLWDMNVEPIASKFDQCAAFLANKDDPLYSGKGALTRLGISQMIHQMRKARLKTLGERKELTSEGIVASTLSTPDAGT